MVPGFSDSRTKRAKAQSVIHVVTTPIQTRYFHNFTTAQIEQMRNLEFHNKQLHNPGVTMAEHEIKIDYEIQGREHPKRDGFYVWTDTVKVNFSFTRMDVYISSQYPEGSCPYNVVVGHENQHVAINTRLLKKYKALIERALKADRGIPTKARPLNVLSMENGRKIIAARINHIVDPLMVRFKNEVTKENGKIDTAQNYRRTQARCKNW
jgi:acyl-CoA thioesterase FadM